VARPPLSPSTALVVAAALTGCFHAQPYAPERTVATWRAMQSPQATTAGAAKRESAPPASDALTAEQTYALALDHNPDLAVLAARAEVAAAGVRAARQLDNPQLRLTNFNIDEAIIDRPGLNIGLRVPIPRPGTVRARVQGAQAEAGAEESVTDDARRQLRAGVYKRFARLAMLTADLDHVTRAAELQGARRQQVDARVEQAVATRLDAALAGVTHAEARDEAARVRAELERVHAELEALAGASPLQFQVDPDELVVRDLALDRDALTEQAMRARPELRAAQSRVGEAQAEAYLARSKAWPWFDWAQVQYRAGPAATAASFGFGVALTLPVFSWNRGEIKATRALVRQRELEERARIAAVAREIDDALARVEQTAARVRELERDLVPQIEAAARETEAALAAGSIDAVKAHEVGARMVGARRALLAAQLAHREAVIDLEAAVGQPLGRR
jgi:cobalt-zinc-cadmium efflux system outer membrane protein